MPDYTAVRLRVPLRTRQPLPDTSAVLWQPGADAGGPVAILGHGAGTNLTNPVLCAVGRGLAVRGVPVLTFNFAYAEAKQRRPDQPARLRAVYADAIAVAEARFGVDRPFVLGGRSMGGRIATLLAADDEARCDALLLLGYPLHPAGRPERLRTEHWPRLHVPLLFVTGDRDRLCDLPLLAAERAAHLAAPSRVHVIAGADHGFAVRKTDPRSMADVIADVVDVSAGWLASAVGRPTVPAGAER